MNLAKRSDRRHTGSVRSQPEREEQAVSIGTALAGFAVVLALVFLLLPNDVHVPGAILGSVAVVAGLLAVISRLAFKRR